MRKKGDQMLIDDTNFTDKASKDPEQRALYEKTDNYIQAYSAHTDWRIKKTGPAQAIGGQWEEHGPLQLQFLRKQGLTPDSRLLDFGCGTGRLARHAVPYLDPGNYVGIDISVGALKEATNLSHKEGWDRRNPNFMHSPDGMLLPYLLGLKFDLIWAHSVFTHLPPEIIQAVLKDLSQMDFSCFYYTYKKRDQVIRTGVKQFGYTPEWFFDAASEAGLAARKLDLRWPQGQSTMVIWNG